MRATSSRLGSLAALFFTLAIPAFAVPENLGGGLQDLVTWYKQNQQTQGDRKTRVTTEHPVTARARVDAAVENATVDVRLDGTRPIPDVRTALEALGLKVLAVHEVAGPGSIISAELPLKNAEAAAKVPGVFSIVLAHTPHRRVGKTTTQGAEVMHTPAVNQSGYYGTGITVGVLSDSYDVTDPPAQDDIVSGDLPGAANPVNHKQPVVVLAEGDPRGGSDEGRAMLQIVHDIAPQAKLVFASTGETQAVFAQRIRALRTDPTALCDVLVDDVGFPDEPFFSDGPIAQAVDDVVHSTTLAGKKVLYYSAAGNDGDLGYDDTFRAVADASVRNGTVRTNLKLGSVPKYLTAGGWQNFSTTAATVVVQTVKVTTTSAELNFQWDDPFIPGLITTDYNLLVFDLLGNYRAGLSGVDHNPNLGQASEFAFLPPGKYQLAIARRATGTQEALHLRYVVHTDGGYEANFLTPNAPTIFGHPAAPGADGVGAYDYTILKAPESYSSFGPVVIYFDRVGNRLAQPETRQQPTISAPDGVNTTFFGDSDPENDGFPNFYGTSAAAPHAAGVAALILQAAGGPGSLSDTQMRTLLENSAGSHDLDPNLSHAIVQTTDAQATVTVTGTGDGSNGSANSPRFFNVSYTGPSQRVLRTLTLDVKPAGLKFDPSLALGFPFTIGPITGIPRTSVKAVFSGERKSVLTLTFAGNAFTPGDSISFGVDRDDFQKLSGGNSADLLSGATVGISTVESGAFIGGAGTFENNVGTGFSPADGFGLIDAFDALQALP
jgi:hypothetical protein